jgi:Co/Zn/Cd efflux system component
VWLCSRNDALGNVAVIVAAGAVWVLASPWPDLVVAIAMAGLFLNSSWQILRQSTHEFREVRELPKPGE